MGERLTKRDLRIAEALDVLPVEQEERQLKICNEQVDVSCLELTDLGTDLALITQLAHEAYQQSQAFAESAEDMMDEKAKATAQSTAASQLNTAINAMDKVARLKLKIIEMKEKLETSNEDEETLTREELIELINSATSKKVQSE